jgi:hypothetical protein
MFLEKQRENKVEKFQMFKEGIRNGLSAFVLNSQNFYHQEMHLNRGVSVLKESEEKIVFLEALMNVTSKDDMENEPIAKALTLAKDVRRDALDEIKKIERIKTLDFGKNKEFFDLLDLKLKYKTEKYEYTIMFFDQATQKEGKTVLSLG